MGTVWFDEFAEETEATVLMSIAHITRTQDDVFTRLADTVTEKDVVL
jgi:hypothetical protein